jgi:hypothetical protein
MIPYGKVNGLLFFSEILKIEFSIKTKNRLINQKNYPVFDKTAGFFKKIKPKFGFYTDFLLVLSIFMIFTKPVKTDFFSSV